MTDYVPIPCSNYELLETACLYHYEVEVTTDDAAFIGTADRLDVRSSEEHLIVTRKDGVTESIRADHIRQLVIRSDPAHYEVHTFKPVVINEAGE